jgi:hypothetical protein
VILQPLGGHVVGGNAAIEHHMRLHDLPPRLVGNADHRAFATSPCARSAASTSGPAML